MKISRDLDTGLRKTDADRFVTDTITRERPRLKAWLRRQIPDPQDVEDILQDAFYELVVAARQFDTVRHVGAWLFTVVRNRVTDRRRQTKRVFDAVASPSVAPPVLRLFDTGEHEERLIDLLPDSAAGPEEAYVRKCMIQALEVAVLALPAEQQRVFIAHEIDGVSFKGMAEASGESINTLLSRKNYAIKSLRRLLEDVRDDVTRG